MSLKINIEGYEEIFYLIKKWFDKSLNISIKVPEDLADGKLYLELLKKCIQIDIPNNKRMNYEQIEFVLNEFYGCSITCAVDFYEFLFVAGCENIICLCILCFVMYRNYNEIPDLNQEDFKRLTYLTMPIHEYLKNKIPFSTENFHAAIEKAKERDLAELSLSSISACKNDSLKTDNRQNGSDDEISNSSNIRSCLSEYSVNVRSVHDSVSELGLNDHGKDSLKRKHKINLINKPRRIPSLFLSPSYRRTINSPKLNESRKLEQRRLKNIEFENGNLKQEICILNEDLEKALQNENKFNLELVKLKQENRKLMDTIDCLNATVEENSLMLTKRDRELEKIRKDMELTKKTVGEKSDEIKQLENSNHKLRHDINELNSKLKNKASQCEESMKIEVSIAKEKHALQLENEQLKHDIEELKKNLKELHNSKINSVDRESLLISPLSVCEEGESMEIINQMKQAEIIEKFETEKKSLEETILKLQSELQAVKAASHNQELDSKLLLVNNQLDRFQTLLFDKDEELRILQEDCTKLNEEIRSFQQLSKGTDKKENNMDYVLDLLQNLLSEIEFPVDDKTKILKRIAGYLKLDLTGFEKNHEICQKDLSSVYQKLKACKEEINQKEQQLEQAHNDLFENDQQISIMKRELSDCRMDNVEIERLYKIHKSKSADVEFKLSQTLFMVEKERKEFISQNANLKTELSIRENELQKSNQEFNILRNRYDSCLEALHKMAKDCEDYEQVIIEVTERQNRPLRSVHCQTDRVIISLPLIATQSNDKTFMPPNLGRYNNRYDLVREIPINQESPYINSNNVQATLRKTLVNKVSVNNEKPIDSREKVLTKFSQNDFANKFQITPNLIKKYPLIHKTNPDARNSNGCDIGLDKLKVKPVIDPTWENIEKILNGENFFCNNSFNHLVVGNNLVDSKKVDSPAVKPSRIHQMMSRNLQQPDHLKSSYPIETQTLGQGYLADCLLKEINYECDDEAETDRPELTPRLYSARHYIPADPLNLRPNGNTQKHFNYNDDSFSDQLIKGTVANGYQNLVLSARSNNPMTPRCETFKVPPLPLAPNQQLANRGDSDRENIIPKIDNSENYFTVNPSQSSISMKFEIPNSPRRKTRSGPRGFYNRNQRN